MLKRAIAALTMATATSGCMQYQIQAPINKFAGTPQTVEAKAYLGGKVQQPTFISAKRCQNGEQLGRVIVQRDFWQGFVSWITLGMITPATVEYTCANSGDPPLGGGGS